MSSLKVEVGKSQESLVKAVKGSLIIPSALALMLCVAQPADAQVRYASGKRSNAAIAHYARARAMCVETLEEFEVGRKHARPDLLLDPEEWRLTMISLCEQLNRLVDPKIRVSNAGIQVSANPRLIKRAKDELPEVSDGPKIRSDYGELARMKEKQDARARMYAPEDAESPGVASTEQQAMQEEAKQIEAPGTEQLDTQQLSEEELIERAIQEAIDSEAEQLSEGTPEEQPSAGEAMQDPQAIIEQQRREEAHLEPKQADQDESFEASQAPQGIAPQDLEPQELEQGDAQDLLGEEGDIEAPVQSNEDVAEIPSEEADLSAEGKQPADSEDAKIASAIEQAIQNKLREIEAAGTADEGEASLEEDGFEE